MMANALPFYGCALVLGGVLSLCATDAPAATRTWTGAAGDGLASTPGNWSPEGVPTGVDDIVLDGTSSSNLLWDAGATNEVQSWLQTGAYSGTVTITTVYGTNGFTGFSIQGDCVVSNGTWRHRDNGNDQTYRLKVSVSGDFFLGSNAVLDAEGRGYDGLRGPGGGITGGYEEGGSHGGFGGGTTRAPYGSVREPEDLGSGGGRSEGYGGGAVYLTVGGHATIDGRVDVDSSHLIHSAHGAGGSIFLRCATLSGEGVLTACCGTGGHGGRGRGAGGRIAVVLTAPGADFDSFAGALVASTVNPVDNDSSGPLGGAGTIYLETGDGVSTLRVENRGYGGEWTSSGTVPTDLNGFSSIVVRAGGRLMVEADDTIDFATAPLASNSVLRIASTNGVSVPDPWLLTNLTVYVDVLPRLHGLELGSAGTMRLLTSAMVGRLELHPGGHLLLHNMPLTVTNDATIHASAAVHADGLGFAGAAGPGFLADGERNGGSHGARGGERNATDNGLQGPCYGSILLPRARGSGTINGGTAGGGVLDLTVHGALTVDGALRARGVGIVEASGSGGSVLVHAGSLAGGGVISAPGGTHAQYGGGGGGGRVALYITTPGQGFGSFTGTVHALAYDYNNATQDGGGGTVYRATADTGFDAGEIRVDFGDIATQHGWCEFPPSFTGSTTYAAATYANTDDVSRASLVLTNRARVVVTRETATRALFIDGASRLDLAGAVLALRERPLLDGVELRAGRYSATNLVLMGVQQVLDSSPGGTGRLVVPATGSVLILQ